MVPVALKRIEQPLRFEVGLADLFDPALPGSDEMGGVTELTDQLRPDFQHQQVVLAGFDRSHHHEVGALAGWLLDLLRPRLSVDAE